MPGTRYWKTVSQYNSAYWSGVEARIYAGSVFLEELVGIQWELQEAVRELRGYHDYVYQSLAHGARRVQGMFNINFTRDAYLYELLRGLTGTRAQTVTPELTDRQKQIQRLAAGGDLTADDLVAVASGAGQASRDSQGRYQFDPKLLQQTIQGFQAAVLGKSQPAPNALVKELLTFTRADRPRFEVPGGFALRIEFGSTRMLTRVQSRPPPRARPVTRVLPFQGVGTGCTLVGAYLTGHGRVIDDSGRVVQESVLIRSP